ncbi:MAG TPA: DUF2892 domain-containing protein [bacterium]|nr:DUF2892 domain-containing protein [bacterium]HPN45981.1 DUF2892 domain-containing protein [bacterium]
MTKNIGSKDRMIRLVVGVLLIVIGIFTNSWLDLIGVLLVVTALIRFCPLYIPLKINTNKEQPKQ